MKPALEGRSTAVAQRVATPVNHRRQRTRQSGRACPSDPLAGRGEVLGAATRLKTRGSSPGTHQRLVRRRPGCVHAALVEVHDLRHHCRVFLLPPDEVHVRAYGGEAVRLFTLPARVGPLDLVPLQRGLGDIPHADYGCRRSRTGMPGRPTPSSRRAWYSTYSQVTDTGTAMCSCTR
jgi:hypothetical protein